MESLVPTKRSLRLTIFAIYFGRRLAFYFKNEKDRLRAMRNFEDDGSTHL